ncbi:MAG: hypothetical protein H6558_22205 [Lewinellaceae bacterium]|nr:hypothetical protein [Lewinellaceae bacterium]
MKRLILPFLFIAAAFAGSNAQGGFAFGIKGGPTIGIQQWEGFEQDPLFKYHGIVFIESITEGNAFGIFAQLGYHQKGSAIRNRNFLNISGQAFRPPAREFIFENLSLTGGAKQKFPFGSGDSKAYYALGVRLDYTINTNLDVYTRFIEANPAYAIYPIDDTKFIREINYGLTLGGGIEIPFSELVGTLIEFTVNPDFSYQYEQPEIPNVLDPYTGNTRSIPQRRIRNLTFELTVGFRFLRKVEYID